jgi:segregation and condensation protein A
VSVREQAGLLGARLRRDRVCSFRSLVADADSTQVIVARFLALLELFRDAQIAFDQVEPLGDLTVRWTGADQGEIDVGEEFDEDLAGASGDQPPGAPSAEQPTADDRLEDDT